VFSFGGPVSSVCGKRRMELSRGHLANVVPDGKGSAGGAGEEGIWAGMPEPRSFTGALSLFEHVRLMRNNSKGWLSRGDQVRQRGRAGERERADACASVYVRSVHLCRRGTSQVLPARVRVPAHAVRLSGRAWPMFVRISGRLNARQRVARGAEAPLSTLAVVQSYEPMSEGERGSAVERIFTSPLPYALGADEMGSAAQQQQGGLLMDALMARDADTVVASLLRRAQVIFPASFPPTFQVHGMGECRGLC
jgi:hypothetical protein